MAKGKFVSSMIDMAEKAGLDMSEAARMARAREMGYDTDFPITHGSPSETLDEIKKAKWKGGDSGNRFDGIFGLSGDAGGFGKYNHTFYPRSGRVASHGDLDFDYDLSMNVLKKEYPDASEDQLDDLYRMAAEDKQASSNPLEDFGYDDADASWEAQRLRGRIAEAHDFDAVAMNDEYGTSYLIPAGSKARKIDAAFDPAKKDSSNILAGAATIGGIGGGAALMATPQNSYADSLHDVVMKAKPTTREIMDSQRKREDYLNQIEMLNREDKAIQAPQSETAISIADAMNSYNKGRKKHLNPILDLILPAGELPSEYMQKIAYGDEVTMADRIQAVLGAL